MCCCCSSFEYDLIAEEYVWRGGRRGAVRSRTIAGWTDWSCVDSRSKVCSVVARLGRSSDVVPGLEVKVDCTRILGEAVQNDCRLAVVRRVQS